MTAMGNCCSCCLQASSKDADNERSPLLNSGGLKSNGDGGTITQQPRKTSNASTSSNGGVVGGKVELAAIHADSTGVNSVDRQLQNHATRFNTYLERFFSLRQSHKELLDSTSCDTSAEAIKHVLQKCGTTLSTTTDSRGIVTLVHDKEAESREASVRAAVEALTQCHESLEQLLYSQEADSVCRAADSLVANRKGLERDLLVASQGAEGPQCMANCKATVALLSTVSQRVELIKVECREMLNALQIPAEFVPDPLDVANANKTEEKKQKHEVLDPDARTTEVVQQPTEELDVVQKWLDRDDKDATKKPEPQPEATDERSEEDVDLPEQLETKEKDDTAGISSEPSVDQKDTTVTDTVPDDNEQSEKTDTERVEDETEEQEGLHEGTTEELEYLEEDIKAELADGTNNEQESVAEGKLEEGTIEDKTNLEAEHKEQVDVKEVTEDNTEDEVADTTVDTTGTEDDVVDTTLDTTGTEDDLADTTVDTTATEDDLADTTVDTTGTEHDVVDTTVDTTATEDDESFADTQTGAIDNDNSKVTRDEESTADEQMDSSNRDTEGKTEEGGEEMDSSRDMEGKTKEGDDKKE